MASAAFPSALLRIAARRAPALGAVRGVACRAFGVGSLQQRPSAAVRGFASEAAAKAAKVLKGELEHEEGEYEQPKEVKSFLKNSEFKFVEEGGDVNMMLERTVGDKAARIEWQLTSPYAPEMEMEGQDDVGQEAVDFVITVENKSGTAGISFYCSTQTGEEHRYIIGHVKNFSSAEEKESASSYNGPDFEDIDDKLQEAFDEYLAEMGMSNEVCDFIDATALDKEQREYVRWLKMSQKFLSS